MEKTGVEGLQSGTQGKGARYAGQPAGDVSGRGTDEKGRLAGAELVSEGEKPIVQEKQEIAAELNAPNQKVSASSTAKAEASGTKTLDEFEKSTGKTV